MRRVVAFANLLVGFLVAAAGVEAAPIVFTEERYDTLAFATSEAVRGHPGETNTSSAASPPSPSPVVSAAVARGSPWIMGSLEAQSSASASAGIGLLSAFTNSSAGPRGGGGDAIGQSRFTGSFAGDGDVTLSLNFSSSSGVYPQFLEPGNATLFVLWTSALGSTTTTFFSNSNRDDRDITLQFEASGGLNTLDLLLSSEAGWGGGPGGASNTARVAFAGDIVPRAIPLPPTWSLVIAGLAWMLVLGRNAANVDGSGRRRATAMRSSGSIQAT